MTTATETRCMSESKDAMEGDAGMGVGVDMYESATAEGTNKRKRSILVNIAGNEIDISQLPPPRPGRPTGKMHQDPIMQEARKRARVLRNRAAAQLSREKKRHHVEQLEEENAELREKNEELEERLSKAESSNAEMSARLDEMAKQLQSFHTILLGAQKQQQKQQSSLTPTMLDWSSIASPLVPSPLHTPLHSVGSQSSTDSPPTYTNVPSTPTFTQTTSSSADVSSVSLLSAIPGSTVTSSAILKPTSVAMELFPNVASSSDLSGKGLSESAALAQSGAHIYCVVSDSQQRRPLPHMESICRKPGLRQQSLAKAALETCTSTSSSKNWGQRMVDMAVSTVVSASAQSSPQALWTIFCSLWWILSRNGGWVSRHQLSRMARGILACPPRASNGAVGSSHSELRKLSVVGAGHYRNGNDGRGLAGLVAVAAWLAPGSRTAAALRRVAGNEPVDQVSALITQLCAATHTAHGSRSRVRSGGLASNKQNPLFYPP
ncbi:hypothetical protein EV174_000180 [Coemansia sp. RSA 2320]|nr:hypothetical protein EV174_000180 [Coemansia sp. RSA 2320]